MKRLILPLLLLLSPPALAEDAGALRAALAEAGRKNWTAAETHAAKAGDITRDLVLWHRLRAGDGTLGEYEDFLARRGDWPGLALLREKGETAVARSSTPSRVVSWFGSGAPRSGLGAVALVRAHLAAGQTDQAMQVARDAWASLSFTPEAQAEMLTLAGPALQDRHWARLDHMLWEGEAAQARQMLALVSEGQAALARARMALRARADGVTALIDAVPPALANDPGLAFERFDWRFYKDMNDEAVAMALQASKSAEALGRPEAWAKDRAALARWLMRNGHPENAWKLAAHHHLTKGSDAADLEFLAGFIALRHLGDAATALDHFTRLKGMVATPISVSRAEYWLGRAHQAAGRNAEAETAFRAAARFQIAYYGQLAAETLGLPLDPTLVAQTGRAKWHERPFAQSPVLKTAQILLDAGETGLAKRFILHLAESQSDADLAAMADMALQKGQPHIAVLLAKQAAERGVILPDAYFPIPDLIPAEGLAVSRAFALAIARRESEFDIAAQSHAGALGLMQLLPETAERMAKAQGISFDAAQLTTDPAFNARLGSAYLGRMVEEFGPSVALVASGYNAGPGRPRRWIAEFGDPRDPQVDVVDWVETIPFTETRSYVMRVAESLVIYRARLKGAAGPVRLTSELRG